MTTIAFRSPLMASDGRVTMTSGRIVTGRAQKIFRLSHGALMGVAGDADVRELLELFERVRSPKHFPASSLICHLRADFRGILAFPDGSVWNIEAGNERGNEEGEMIKDQWYAQIMEVRDPFYAVGSGAYAALAAMECGKTAEQAVRIAIKYDSNSGGSIHVAELQLKRRVNTKDRRGEASTGTLKTRRPPGARGSAR